MGKGLYRKFREERQERIEFERSLPATRCYKDPAGRFHIETYDQVTGSILSHEVRQSTLVTGKVDW